MPSGQGGGATLAVSGQSAQACGPGKGALRNLERFHDEWKHSSSYFASNFISLKSLCDYSQADIALALGQRHKALLGFWPHDHGQVDALRGGGFGWLLAGMDASSRRLI